MSHLCRKCIRHYHRRTSFSRPTINHPSSFSQKIFVRGGGGGDNGGFQFHSTAAVTTMISIPSLRQRTASGILSIRRKHTMMGAAASAFKEIPILHLPPPMMTSTRTVIRDDDDDEHIAFARELRSACHNVGFFYIANHGVKDETYAKALESTRRFFDLDLTSKMKLDYRNSPAFRGYIRCDAENTAGRPDHREQVELGVDVATPTPSAAAATTTASNPFYKRLIGPNQWPDDSVPELRPHVSQFMSEMEVLSRRLMTYLALSLDLQADFFDETFGESPNVQLKICKYPPILPAATSSSEKEEEEGDGGGGSIGNGNSFGVGAHTDSGYLSLLLQDEVGGLQVQNGDGHWIDAPPIPGTVVVNLGEMLQLCTNGYFLATPHRVLSANGSQARYSLPYFWNPHLDYHVTKIDPLPTTLSWERPRPTKDNDIAFTSSHGMAGNRLMNCYGANAFKSLARSHPAVMERHHNDLLLRADGSIQKIPTIAATATAQ